MIQINSEKELKLAGLSIIKFYSEICKPCKRMDTILVKMEKEFPHMVFYAVDINNCIELTKKYQIRSVPTLIMFREDIQIGSMVGLYNTEQIRGEFKKISEMQ